ncbi:unnamed protein product [Gongylonema pulchrum]|uniref:Uncharacterized protein n=1 Tax=Gongylonema pulchrum TaxID=637853 RepID=A0A183ENG0_9BILA|nr:unnamed protein product [Gongylonema pulchrum]
MDVFRLCPGRKFRRDEIPYQTVKEMVGKHLDNLPPQKRRRILEDIKKRTSQGCSRRSSRADLSPSGSRNEMPMPSASSKPTLSEARRLLLMDRHHLLPQLEDINEAQKIHLKFPKHLRKTVRMRTERRLAAETNTFHNIVCEEEHLPEEFRPIYDRLLSSGKSSLDCCHIIINTLHHYFMRVTWTDYVLNTMNEFISRHVMLDCDELTTKYDRRDRGADIHERLREYELLVLLEFHLIKEHPERVEETDVCFSLLHL